jgi:hypothetical protein
MLSLLALLVHEYSFTGATVQILTQLRAACQRFQHVGEAYVFFDLDLVGSLTRGTQFTCFTSTQVQILTPAALQCVSSTVLLVLGSS